MAVKDWINTTGERVSGTVVETARKITRVIIGHGRFGPVILEDDGSRRPIFLPGLRPENNRPVQYDGDETIVFIGRDEPRGE
jgi:hypothetical protein